MKRLIIGFVVLCMCIALCSGCAPSNSEVTVIISEIMPRNNGVLADDVEAYPAWIELYNPSDSDVSLSGYTLGVQSSDTVCILGEWVLKAGQYLLIYADSSAVQDVENGIIHCGFTLHHDADTVFLLDDAKHMLSEISYTDVKDNVSYGRTPNGNVCPFTSPTPNAINTNFTTTDVDTPQSNITVCINEYATDDTVTVADTDGDFTAWVELYNYGETAVNMQGIGLSDDSQKKDKWVFPDIELQSGEFLLVYLSKKIKEPSEDGALYAGFNLTGKEESLILSEAGGMCIDSCPVYQLTSNLTYGHPIEQRDKRQFFAKATPMASNTFTGFDKIESALYPQNKELVITEVAPVHTNVKQAADGAYYDYIELYNPTKKAVSLNRYRLSDAGNMRNYYTLPNAVVPAKGYYVIWCGTDTNDFGTTSGETYITMGLNRYGEKLYIADTDGVVIDNIETERLSGSGSCGRVSMSDATVYRFDTLTPQEKNPETGLGGPAPSPLFSVAGGYVERGTSLSISCPNATIYYTLDGSTPTTDSMRYTMPITIDKTMTVRAVAYMKGRMLSDTRAVSFITDKRHTLPVMFLSTDPSNFFDYYTGIWADGPGYNTQFPHTGANYWKDWERPVHVEYMDAKGQIQLEFDAGVKIFGQYSRANAQKSMSINMRDKYGVTELCYPFFGDDSVTNVYSELVLRAAGQDNNKARLRDTFCSSVVAGQMDLDYMDYQPIVVYLNGEYWGLYDLREKICESYVANRTGCDENQIDMIKGNDMVMSGSYDAYEGLLNYVDSHDLSNPTYYAYVSDRVDVQEFINYWMAETFFVNTDTGNIKFYQAKDIGGKWRWVMFDYDWALYPSTHWQNYLEEIVNPSGHGVGKAFSTKLMRGLMENAEFRELFKTTYVTHLKTTFSTERMLQIYDDMVAEIEPEMAYQIEKWGTHSSVDAWKSSVNSLRDIIKEQNDIITQAFIKTLSGTTSNRRLSSIWREYYNLSKKEVEALFE